MDSHTIINIGRRFGSGGLGVAKELSRQLGIPVYDNEIITAAARQSGMAAEQFKVSDEKRRFFNIGRLFGSTDDSDPVGGLSDAQLFKIQSDTIRSIAENGPAIFVGRASNYVLRDMDCLDVFINASVETRKARIAEREGITPEEAEIMMRKRDRSREAYYNFFTLGHWGDSSDYDLCIYSDILGIEKTAAFIIEYGRSAGLIKSL